jgi:DNA mismatch endonuclease (patch repair protein)
VMARVRSARTAPEMLVRQIVRKTGLKFRGNVKSLPGAPDIVIGTVQKAIFVNGCFWHHHSRCKRARLPRSNADYWRNKIARNVTRDSVNKRRLRRLGWSVLTVWECHLKRADRVAKRVEEFLNA